MAFLVNDMTAGNPITQDILDGFGYSLTSLAGSEDINTLGF